MRKTISAVVLLGTLLISSCGQNANDAVAAGDKTTSIDYAANASNSSAIPGPRTCFWARGPHSADPYINIAYPDANVFYWAAVFTMPEGATLNLNGEYPYSRYMSLISYDERGRPIESLADYLIEPGPSRNDETQSSLPLKKDTNRFASLFGVAHAQKVEASGDPEKSINPFIPGNVRNSPHRGYSVQILNRAPEVERAIGERAVLGSGNILHTPGYGRMNQQVILYRIYLPDEGTAPAGGVSLPEPELKLADGTVLTGDEACQSLRTRQPLAITLDAVGVPPNEYRELITQPDKPDTWPSKIPAEWFIQLDRESLLGIYTGFINPEARRSEGGFYPNLDNHYIRTIINRKHGKVFMVRGKAPTTPKTHGGDTIMGDGELRYWSICSNQGLSNTRVNDCLFDEEIPLDPRGYYTVIVSREEDRPRNAIPECGLGWLPMAEDGDGIFDPDVTVVQIRHMLTAPDFEHSVQKVFRQEDLNEVMAEYMPVTRYGLPNQIEAFFPCLQAAASSKEK
jgi:hypothetical protein